MRHFGDEEWADFARDEGAAEQRARMQHHLDEGCRRCSRRLAVWSTVRRLASREAAYRPPDGAVRLVRGQYALERPRSDLRRASLAALVFDSFRAPLPVGVRSAGTSTRQLLYRSGGRLVKLRVDRDRDSERMSLVGQVVDERNPYRELQNLPVLVQSGRKTVSRTLTNRLGEFEVEFEPARSLRLSVGIPGPKAITLRLPLGADDSDAESRGRTGIRES
jgi:hypothetical protein